MRTLDQVEAPEAYVGSEVIVSLRGAGGGLTPGLVRAVHDDGATVTVPRIGETYDFEFQEVWTGRWVVLAFANRPVVRLFVGDDDLEALQGDVKWLAIECMAADDEGVLQTVETHVNRENLDYMLFV